jgi:hypothetical protein
MEAGVVRMQWTVLAKAKCKKARGRKPKPAGVDGRIVITVL